MTVGRRGADCWSGAPQSAGWADPVAAWRSCLRGAVSIARAGARPAEDPSHRWMASHWETKNHWRRMMS